MFASQPDDYPTRPTRISYPESDVNPVHFMQPDNRQMDYDTLLNEPRRIDFTRQDCTNFCRSNPQTMTRQRVDQFVRHVDRMLIFAHHNPHSQPEAEALRTLHAHLHHTELAPLLQYFFNRDANLPCARSHFWRFLSFMYIQTWHSPPPQRHDLATGLQSIALAFSNRNNNNNNNNNNRNNNNYNNNRNNNNNNRNNNNFNRNNNNFNRNNNNFNRNNNFQRTNNPNILRSNSNRNNNNSNTRYFRILPSIGNSSNNNNGNNNRSQGHTAIQNTNINHNRNSNNNNNRNSNSNNNSRNNNSSNNNNNRNFSSNNNRRVNQVFVEEIQPDDDDYPENDDNNDDDETYINIVGDNDNEAYGFIHPDDS